MFRCYNNNVTTGHVISCRGKTVIMQNSRLRDILNLAVDLQSSSIGMTKKQMLESIKDRGYEISQRTLERWLFQLQDVGLEYEVTTVETDHGKANRYKVTGLPNALLKLQPTERSALERYATMVSDTTTKDALNKVLSTQTNLSTAMINNLQELIDQTAHTNNVQPTIEVNPKQMDIIERSIQGLTEIRFKYKTQKSRTATQKQEKPIGLIYGRFGYLVCLGYKNKPIIYRLDLIEEVLETNTFFVKPETFNFKEWSEESFGVYHGDEKITVEVVFSPKVSTRAEKIKFHPSQHLVWQKDNSLKMYFKCKGWKELIHELLHPDWQGELKIVSPKEFKDAVKDYLKESKGLI